MSTGVVIVHGDLIVCGRCGEVKGPVPGADAVQLCGCASQEQYRAQPRRGRDFPKWLELCKCCGLRTVSSGSRWSHFHCGRCRPRVAALNDFLGRCVVPQGRHSLMNGVGLKEPVGQHPVVYTAFADQLHAFLLSAADLQAWGARVVLDQLVALRFDPGADVSLDAYLGEAEGAGLRCEDSFVALVQEVLPGEDCSALISACLGRPPVVRAAPPTPEDEAASRAKVRALYEGACGSLRPPESRDGAPS